MRDETKEVAKVVKYHRKPMRRPQEAHETTKNKQYDKCGQEKHSRPQDCPARAMNCMKCPQERSLCNCLQSKASLQPATTQRKKEGEKRRVRRTAAEEQENSTSSDDEFFEHLKQAKNIKSADKQSKTITLRISDVDVRVEPDSGADVMDEHRFKALVHRSQEKQQLQESKIKLNTLQNKLPVKVEFNAIARNKTRGVSATFIVVKGRINSAPLIGRPTLIDLGMLKIDPEGTLAATNSLRISEEPQVRTVTTNGNQSSNPSTDEIVSKYNKVFEGIGKIRDNKRNEELYVQFSMKQEAVPIAQKPRPVAYHLKEPLRKWLDQGIEEDIF